MNDGIGGREHSPTNASAYRHNDHPTVKPVELMRHLVRLVTVLGGTVLDPFMGSGTTAIACMLEGMEFVGIEQDAHYIDIVNARLASTRWVKEAERLRVVRAQGGFWEAPGR
jgi:DNA modification methylase